MQEGRETPVFRRIQDMGGFPVHCSHRGGCGESFGPENTLFSFRRSVHEFQTQLLEIDLQMTADGEVILLHDLDLDRTTNGRGDARLLTLAEIKKLDAAFHYPELRGTGITIPTFIEFLDEFAKVPLLMFMLDFKDADCVPYALELVKKYAIEDRILLGAVPSDANNALQKLKPQGVPIITDYTATVAITSAYWFGALHWYDVTTHDIFGYFLSEYTSMFFCRGLVEAVHKAGRKVLVCGNLLDDCIIQQQCLDFGVDFIMSDRPDLLKTTMQRLIVNK